MNRGSQPNRARFQAHESKDESRDDRAERFRQRFAEMDHAIRHHHHEDDVGAETVFQSVDEEAAEEEVGSFGD